MRNTHGRLTGQIPPGASGAGLLRDTDQPFLFDIRFTKKVFTLEAYDVASPNQHWTTLNPDVVLLAFDISNRETLAGLKAVSTSSANMDFIIDFFFLFFCQWRHDIIRYFQHGQGERIPVMLVGLKRDLRKEGEGIIYPQEVSCCLTIL